MKLSFHKYHGTGNDFIMLDDRENLLDTTQLDIPKLSDRHFGIGSDGVIILRKHPDHDFEMVFYNPDGSQSFCGNGSRCAMQFAMDLGMVEKEASFLSTDGVHTASQLSNGWIKLNMADTKAPVKAGNDLELNTGSPHYVVFTKLDLLDIVREARAIRYNDKYKAAGINVNFVEPTEDGIRMRTYERGVEDETLSCGTGVTAAALATHFKQGKGNGAFETRVKTLGGELLVQYSYNNEMYTDVFLCGPAKKVFSGTIDAG